MGQKTTPGFDSDIHKVDTVPNADLVKPPTGVIRVGARDIAAICRQSGNRVLYVLLLDRSTSLRGFEEEIQAAVNDHVERLRTLNDGVEYYLMVMSFGDTYRIEVPPTHLSQFVRMRSYIADGNTLLYVTVYKAIKLMLQAIKDASPEQLADFKINFATFTDGDDTASPKPKYLEKVRKAVEEGLTAGFEFFLYGFGPYVDAKKAARHMHMPDDDVHAKGKGKDRAGFSGASMDLTASTTCFIDKRFMDQDPDD